MPEDIHVGAIHLRFLRSRHDTANVLDLFEMTVPPGAQVPAPHHHRDWEETVYGLGGCLAFMVDGRWVDLRPGESLYIPRGVVHGFRNVGDAPASCLNVLTPGIIGPEYFRELGAMIREGVRPDPAAIHEVMERYGLIPGPWPA